MNHTLVCKPSIIFLLTIRFLNPFFQLSNCQKVEYRVIKNFYIPLYYSFCPCICNIVSSIGCCYCIIIQLSFLLNIFLFRGCKYHTDMLYKFVLISCVIPLTLQQRTLLKGLNLSLVEPLNFV